MSIGMITDTPLGRPRKPSPFGPSQPSAPTTHTMDMIRPASDNTRSEGDRRKRNIRAAISTKAPPISGPVSSLYAL